MIRLLNAKSMKLKEFGGFSSSERPAKYAIVSHVWFKGDCHELTFNDLQQIRAVERKDFDTYKKKLDATGDMDDMEPSFTKIMRVCQQAISDGIEWVWMDSCCMKKQDSDEAQRSINSMFEWYEHAERCYVFLADVPGTALPANGAPKPEWFTRGWTLQELLAHPWANRHLFEFYNADWKKIGTKDSLSAQIVALTGISHQYLRDYSKACIAVVLSWAASRKTTFEADKAYCLLGLLHVSMTVRYGGMDEKLAFRRLQERVINDRHDESIFAWTLPAVQQDSNLATFGMVAPSIDCFSRCGNLTVDNASKYQPRHHAGYKISGDSLIFRIPTTGTTPIVSSVARDFGKAPINVAISKAWRQHQRLSLNCWSVGSDDNNKTTVEIELFKDDRRAPWQRLNCYQLHWTDSVLRSKSRFLGEDTTKEFVIPC